MKTFNIGNEEYKVKFGYNCFCDTDLLDRVQELATILNDEGAETDKDVNELGKIKDLFNVVRDLLFVGFQKLNPVNKPQDIGDLLDEYREEAPEGEDRGLMQIFGMLADELVNSGFLSDILVSEEPKKVVELQDHKKKTTKK